MQATCITHLVIQPWLRPRPPESHKGDFGSVAIIGGAPGMVGAALLAGRAALSMGAGRVFVGLLDERIPVDPSFPELMLCSPEQIFRITPPGCLVIGPGLGHSGAAGAWLEAGLGSTWPILIDADGLNLLSENASLRSRLHERRAPTLLTPHPGEAGRLLGTSSRDIQADRIAAVASLSATYAATVILKGAGTLVHATGQEIWLNTTGNPGMAAPGMGDVLSGMIAALIAQGLNPLQAAIVGVHLHGAAADAAVATGTGPVGLAASEVVHTARTVLNGWIYPAG